MKNDRVEVRLTREEWAWILAMRQARICAEKRPFDYKAAALREAIRLMTRVNDPSPPLKAYLCPCCHKWHLTSQVQGRGRRDG